MVNDQVAKNLIVVNDLLKQGVRREERSAPSPKKFQKFQLINESWYSYFSKNPFFLLVGLFLNHFRTVSIFSVARQVRLVDASGLTGPFPFLEGIRQNFLVSYVLSTLDLISNSKISVKLHLLWLNQREWNRSESRGYLLS